MSDTVITEESTPIIENLKLNIDHSVFPHFTFSHFTSEHRVPSEGFIKVDKVADGTFFPENVVIDEYANN